MKITLNPEQEKVINSLIQSGQYPSADEAIAAAIELLTESVYLSNEDNRKQYEEWLKVSRQKVAVGLEQLERGESRDGEEVMTQLLDKINQARSQ